MRFIFYIVIVLAIVSCRQHEIKKHTAIVNHPPDKNEKEIKDKFITFACAVIVNPSDWTIDMLKKNNPGEDYNTIVDDNMYYMSQSTAFLDSVKIRQLQKKSSGSVFFKTKAGEVFEVKLDTLSWAILLFNGTSKPLNADMTVINDDYKNYMK